MTDALYDFFTSDFAKQGWPIIVAGLIIAFLLGAFLMWFIMGKIYLKILKNDKEEAERKAREAEEKATKLESSLKTAENRIKELEKFATQQKIYKQIEAATEQMEDDEVLEQFTHD